MLKNKWLLLDDDNHVKCPKDTKDFIERQLKANDNFFRAGLTNSLDVKAFTRYLKQPYRTTVMPCHCLFNKACWRSQTASSWSLTPQEMPQLKPRQFLYKPLELRSSELWRPAQACPWGTNLREELCPVCMHTVGHPTTLVGFDQSGCLRNAVVRLRQELQT